MVEMGGELKSLVTDGMHKDMHKGECPFGWNSLRVYHAYLNNTMNKNEYISTNRISYIPLSVQGNSLELSSASPDSGTT